MIHPLNCPHCSVLLDAGDIYDEMYKQYNDHDKAFQAAKCYGWSQENKLRFSNIVGVYDMEQDRTSHFICPKCEKRIDD